MAKNWQEEWTKEELVDAFVTFKHALLYIKSNRDEWYDIVGRCDREMVDIRHKVEMHNIEDPKERDLVLELMNKSLTTRRKYKDYQDLFLNISDFFNKTNLLFSIINQMESLFESMQQGRKYVVRELTELFPSKR